MNITIENFEPMAIAYYRQIGPYGANNVTVMTKIKNWATDQNLFNKDAVILGIIHDNPTTTAPENCRYDAAIIVTANYPEIEQTTLAGGKYAVMTLEHTVEAMQAVWENIASAKLNLDSTRPILERYPRALVDIHLCQICIPVD
ncbi:AraC family transcriptional regulator [Culicoidibacter larvae]|uniref:DNA gyrase inhibitor n=1 Tax=Culicoidibacter larvae TaxID=2579976 RepID=A0A5R8QFE7_9FIRM|nr:GyrI-like domain-containing protein [Culicoidibacter larvae]TLG76718.1 DNA gyrase inhibitor [Culicoidibacter larvae]